MSAQHPSPPEETVQHVIHAAQRERMGGPLFHLAAAMDQRALGDNALRPLSWFRDLVEAERLERKPTTVSGYGYTWALDRLTEAIDREARRAR
jgi:hypothetical protein